MGIPVLRFHWKWSDYELRQVAHQQKTFAEIIDAMGGKMRETPAADPSNAIRAGGNVKHEVGGAIMGNDPHKSVTNAWAQTWDVKNVFLTAGSSLVAISAGRNHSLALRAEGQGPHPAVGPARQVMMLLAILTSRRDAIKWMLSAVGSVALVDHDVHRAQSAPPAGAGYGVDPNLLKTYTSPATSGRSR